MSALYGAGPLARRSSAALGRIASPMMGTEEPSLARRCLAKSKTMPLPVPPPSPKTRTTIGWNFEVRTLSLKTEMALFSSL